MKVVLLHDVPKLGKKYEVKNVSDGHALNFLIPKRLAEAATDGLVKKIEKLKSEELENKKKHEETLLKALETVKGKGLEISEKANEKGHLFSAIHKKEIIALVKKNAGIDLTEEMIHLEKPIKEIGEHAVDVKAAGKTVSLKLTIKAA